MPITPWCHLSLASTIGASGVEEPSISLMPSFTGKHNGSADSCSLQKSVCLLPDVIFDILPLPVESTKLSGKLSRFERLLAADQVCSHQRMTESAGRVQAGSN